MNSRPSRGGGNFFVHNISLKTLFSVMVCKGMNEGLKALFLKVTCRNIVALYKSFLVLMETVQVEHNDMLAKLKEVLPEKYHTNVDSCNYFTQTKFSTLRKTILDAGNDSVRKISQSLDDFQVEFTFKKEKDNEDTTRVRTE